MCSRHAAARKADWERCCCKELGHAIRSLRLPHTSCSVLAGSTRAPTHSIGGLMRKSRFTEEQIIAGRRTAVRRLSAVTTLFSQQLLQQAVVRCLIRDQLLELAILLLERLQPPRFAHLQPTVLPPPAVKRRLGDPELPTEIDDPCSAFMLLQRGKRPPLSGATG